MGTYVIGVIVFGLIGLATYNVYKGRKNGEGCGYGCKSCSACPGNQSPAKF